MTIAGPPQIHGAAFTPLDSDAARSWLAWLTAEGPAPSGVRGIRFALAHCDSGVTWAYLDKQGVWRLGSAVDPALCPRPTAASLHELRLFGATSEVLLWRADDGQLCGRILADDSAVFNSSDPLRPMNERRFLRGGCRETRNGLKHYVDVGGAQHLAPESFPEEFHVRHYFEQDTSTGAARIAAVRLVPEKL